MGVEKKDTIIDVCVDVLLKDNVNNQRSSELSCVFCVQRPDEGWRRIDGENKRIFSTNNCSLKANGV